MPNKGAMIRAVQQREASLESYYRNPNKCLYCGEVIRVPEGRKVGEVRRYKFCCRSHIALYQNKKNGYGYYGKSSGNCETCGKEITYTRIRKYNTYYPKRFCSSCLKQKRLSDIAHLTGRKIDTLVGDRTKAELFQSRKGYQSARSTIQRHAVKVYKGSGKPMECFVCGYKTHVNIAHVKGVAEFSGRTLIKQINDPKNLVALCPTHHWEFDHKIVAIRCG